MKIEYTSRKERNIGVYKMQIDLKETKKIE